MSDITLSRDGTSVTIKAIEEAPNPTIVRSQSKPQQEIQPVSQVDPRVSDQFQSVPQWTINGYIEGTNAYVNARTLAEELIKPHSGGNDLTLDLSNVSGLSTYTVAPNQPGALELTYPPGQRDLVEVSLQLAEVDQTVAGAATSTVTPSTTTPNDGGSVTLTNPANSQSITLSERLNVTRRVGRPNGTVRPNPSSVLYIDKVRSASDVFELSGRLTDANARTDATTLIEDILGDPLGRDSLTLTFDNDLFALDSYEVVPDGSRAGRSVISAGEGSMVSIQGLTLRVVTT